jgi:competence protein ComEC
MQSRPKGLFGVGVVLALGLGALSAWAHLRNAEPLICERTTRVTCTVLDSGAPQTGFSTYTCRSDAGPAYEVIEAGAAPVVGTHLLLRGRIENFDGPRNPGEPDDRELERERGLSARISGAHVLRTLPPAPLNLTIAIARIHAWALSELRARLGEPYASILAGELWGERASLPPQLHTEFQETGTVHVLVTAGLHLGVVSMALLALFRVCGVPRAMACALAIAGLWMYALFSGLHLPSVRAAVMISFALAARGAGAASKSWNAYGAALCAIALFWPDSITSASFALSFSCVGAILLTADEIAHALEHFALPHLVKEALALTISTQLGTWPLTAAIFLIFSPYAILANLMVVPVVGCTMILGGVQLLATPFPLLAQLAANLNAWLLAWIVAAVSSISSLPGAAIPMTPPHAWTIACYDAGLIAAVWLWKRDARTPALLAFAIGVSLVLTPPIAVDHRLRITVLDVGQADGIVIQTPAGHTILVDAGGRLERGSGAESTAEQVGERVVVPFLRRAGVRHIDALILSHPHGDHVGGMAPVLRAFHVDEFADSGQPYGGYAYQDALQMARAEHVPIVYPRAGTVWKTDDGLTLTFIGPSLPLITGSQNDINNNSIAFLLQYKQFRMLFTGDAGVEAEQRFLNEGIDLHADVLKVGHHGSAYSSSSAFIASVHPRYAIISVGRHNMFGHPAPATIETLQRFGARVYRTDENGATTIKTDGNRNTTIAAMLY